jgi:integrase
VGDKKAADEVTSKLLAKLQLGEFGFDDSKSPPTFKEYAESWIKTTVPATCEPSTVREYQDILKNHVYAKFGDKQDIAAITRGEVKEFLLEKFNEGYATSTVAHFRNCLSAIFNLALDHEIIQVSPAQRLGKNFIKKKEQKKDINPLASDELAVLIDTFKAHFPDHYTLVLLLARTGLSIGESFALRWGDIDYHGRSIEVNRSYVRGRISTPKNGNSRRVDMSWQLAATLKAHELVCKKKGYL